MARAGAPPTFVDLKNTLKHRLGRGLGVHAVEQHVSELVAHIVGAIGTLQQISGSIAALQRAVEALGKRVEGVEAQLSTLTLNQHFWRIDDDRHYRDHLLLDARLLALLAADQVRLETAHPVAVDSDDHKHPWGTMNDNTRSPRFVRACERLKPGRLHVLDIGCAGGGAVLDFLVRGHLAVGLEGSNASLLAQRAEWRLLEEKRLFTCDVTKPFALRDGSGALLRFDVLSAWEFLEHIEERDLAPLLANLRQHLAPGGLFVGSVATTQDTDPKTGAVYHRTVQPRSWWVDLFQRHGFTVVDPAPFNPYDYCRGTGNGPMDADFNKTPDTGFHLVARAS